MSVPLFACRRLFRLLLLLQQVADLGQQLLIQGRLRLLGSGCRSGLLLLLLHRHELIHALYHEEYAEGEDREVNALLDEGTVAELADKYSVAE